MKVLNLEQMEKVEGGWTLVCEVDSFVEIWGDDWFFGHYEVSNCYFEF